MQELRQHWKAELELAEDLGLIDREDRRSLLQEAQQQNRAPRELLLDRGMISEETFAQLGQVPVVHLDEVPTAETKAQSTPVNEEDRYFPKVQRFDNKGLLGQGGMARVFLAWDNQLNRDIALKIFSVTERHRATQMVREARFQAHLRHDRICKVFDVGEAGDVGFVAMEYIDGETLKKAAGTLSQNALVEMVRLVSLAIHEAHGQGLIHRDIKPTNIMVKHEADGPLPFVMDFGLAHPWAEGDVTHAEAGTPLFMAPEQAMGQAGCLDPRTDVYALGATLYWCLTGQAPIMGSNNLEVLSRIPVHIPANPSQLSPKVPRDLGCIVMKCLEKERGDRYGSALAFAQDLERFLTGQAVLARGRGNLYRMSKFLLRHKWRTVLVALILMVGTGFSINTALERRNAEARTAFVAEMMRRSKEVEAQIRFKAMSPAHPIAQDRKALLQMMEDIAAEAEAAGELGRGAGDYALGQGYLSLGDYHQALIHLQQAWEDGAQSTDSAYALARVHGALYQLELLKLATVSDVSRRSEIREKAVTMYRTPALAFLDRVNPQGTRFPQFVMALMAFYEERFDEALHLLATNERPTWFYEGDLLTGDVYTGKVLAATDPDTVEDGYKRGIEAYERAGTVAPSDPRAHFAAASLHFILLRKAIYAKRDVTAYYEASIEAVDKALSVDEHHYQSLLIKAQILHGMAEYRMNRAENAEDLLEEAVRHGEKAIALQPNRAEGLHISAENYLSKAFLAIRVTKDPTAMLHKAHTLLQRVAAEDRDAKWFFNWGLVNKHSADYAAQIGGDPAAKRAEAIAGYRRAIELRPNFSGAKLNLGVELMLQARNFEGEARVEGLRQTIEAFQQAADDNPGNFLPPFYLAQCFGDLAREQWRQGLDPEPLFNKALDQYQAAIAINERIPLFFQGMAVVWLDLARFHYYQGFSLAEIGPIVEGYCQQALALNNKDGVSYLVLGNIAMWRAMDEMRQGRNARPFLKKAEQAAEKARALLPNMTQVIVFQAHLSVLRAGEAYTQGKKPLRLVDRAFTLLDQGYAGKSRDAYRYFVEGVSWTLRGLFSKGLDDQWVEMANCAYKRALEAGPTNIQYRLGYVRHLMLVGRLLPEQQNSFTRAVEILADTPEMPVGSTEVDTLWQYLDDAVNQQNAALGPWPFYLTRTDWKRSR